jgi:antirestriction protein ArdC
MRRGSVFAAGDGPRPDGDIMAAQSHQDVHARVTDAIIAAIQKGAGQWRMPWHHGGSDIGRPTNVISGQAYRGINTVSLSASAYSRNFLSGLWGTFRQWQQLGAQVRKGERGSCGVLWKEIRRQAVDARDDEQDRPHLFACSFSLFNADQVDGYVPQVVEVLPEAERVENAERFIRSLDIATVFGSGSAYYRIDEDRIHMPDFAMFHDAHGFYATHIHECAHATGAKHRLDRGFSGQWARHELALEEMVAELTASFILADLGIAHEPRPDHAAYIASWLKLLRHEPRAIFIAASKAQAAADWMHARQL